MSQRISIMVCVNNPDNGHYAGRLAGLHIDDFMQLDARVLPEPRCTLRDSSFSVHRMSINVYSHQTWVGNWCWDAITVDVTALAELLTHMFKQKSGDFRVWGIEQAEGDDAIAIMDRLEKGNEPSVTDWLAALTCEVQS